MDDDYYVFIDESGTPSLHTEKNGVLPYLVYSAVVICGKNLSNACNTLNDIQTKYFPQNKYLKSQHIPNDHNGYVKTINILTELKGFEHYVYTIVIDKSKINIQSGLSYKSVFIKYFNRIIAQHLTSDNVDLHIVFDKTGYIEFQDELANYMKKNGCGVTLFSNNTFKLSEDQKEEPLLQIADFYAGTISKYYCGKFDKNKASIIHDNFLRKKVSIEWFPRNSVPMFAAETAFESTYNDEITKIAIQSAINYLDKNKDDTVGCELILYFLQETQRNPLRYISSKEIKSSLKARNVEIGDPIVKVSELRDKGVFIISPIGKKGYKFPNNVLEIAEFYNRLISNILPQLKRCTILNKVLWDNSKGQYNLLASTEFDVLSKLCDIASGLKMD